MRFLQALYVVSILFFATPVLAQVENGDFEMPDGDGWLWDDNVLHAHVEFKSTEGNPAGYVLLSNTLASNVTQFAIGQPFACADSTISCDSCIVSFDVRVVVLTGSGATGKANVSMGGGPNSSYTSGNSGTTPWTRVTIGGAGRNHFLSVGLRVLANAQWEISYDNFTSTCLPGVAVEPSTWGRIKAFRY